MSSYGKQSYLKKKVSYQSQKNSEKISKLNSQFIHQILDTINISLLILIFVLFFLSFNSQRKWSDTYNTLLKTKVMNNNLIDYISKTEEIYISELESINTNRKTKPEDLIYIDKLVEKNKSFIVKNMRSFIEGLRDSRYQKGY